MVHVHSSGGMLQLKWEEGGGGYSIEEVYCYVAVKSTGNIVVHALIESFFICNVEVKLSLDFICL